MDSKEYIDRLRTRLSRYYDFKELAFALPVELCAELNVSDEGYFLIPALKTYSVSHNEYLYVVLVKEQLSEELLTSYLELLKNSMKVYKPQENHMSSIFSIVFVCEKPLPQELIHKYVGFKFHKDYMFTLRGWSDLALYLVDMSVEALYHNKAGKKNAGYFSIKNG